MTLLKIIKIYIILLYLKYFIFKRINFKEYLINLYFKNIKFFIFKINYIVPQF